MSIKDNENSSVREALHSAVEEVASQSEVQETSQEQAVEQPEVIEAPSTWEQADRDAFGKITDVETRKWLLKRDTDYGDKIKGLEPAQLRLQAFDKVLEPHAERLKSTGQEPAAVFDNLLKAQMVLEQKPMEGMLWLVNQYGIDRAQLIAALNGESKDPPAADEDNELGFTPAQLKWINERIAPADKVIEGVEAQKKAENDRIIAETTQATKEFREELDTTTKQPMRPYITHEEVSKRMATLIKTGEVPIVNGDVKSALKEAYDQACRSVPSIRDKYLESIKTQVPDPDKERLLKARRAGVGVTGVGGSQSSRQPKGTVREQLATQFRDAGILP